MPAEPETLPPRARATLAALVLALPLLVGMGRPVTDVQACRLPGAGALGWNAPAESYAPGTGTLSIAVVPVDFPDHPATSSDRRAMDVGLRDMTAFLERSSAGRLDVQVAVAADWTRLPEERATYTGDDTTARHWTYVRQAIAGVPPTAQVVLILGAGVRTGYPGGAAIITAAGSGVPVPGETLDRVATVGLAVDEIGRVMAHEVLHTLGLLDLYDPDGDDPYAFTGPFSLMADVAARSPLPTAWERWRLGWLADGQVRCVTGERATARLGGAVEAMVVPTGPGTAVVVERRRSVGVLVTRVDTDRGGGEGPIRVVGPDGRPAGLAPGRSVLVDGVGVRVLRDGRVRIDRVPA